MLHKNENVLNLNDETMKELGLLYRNKVEELDTEIEGPVTKRLN